MRKYCTPTDAPHPTFAWNILQDHSDHFTRKQDWKGERKALKLCTSSFKSYCKAEFLASPKPQYSQTRPTRCVRVRSSP